MKRFTVAGILILLCLASGNLALEGAKKNTAMFNGSINGKKVRFLSGEVAMAGTSPYLLISVLHAGDHWMFDIKGVRKNAMKTRLSIFAMERKGRKLVASYSGAADVAVQSVKNRPELLGSSLSLKMKARNGKTFILKGVVYWNVKVLPAQAKAGMLKVAFEGMSVGPEKAKLEPWNNGVQVQKLFVVRPGVTLNVNLQFPSGKPGTYRGKMRIMYFRMVKGQLVSSIYDSENIRVSVTRDTVRFSGNVSDSRGKTRHPVQGILNR